jgi:predicted CXXCH cytochrome family protein
VGGKRAVLAFLTALIISGSAHGTIIGSKHDLSAGGGGSITSDSSFVCYFCHSVHTPDEQASIGGYPMWNKDLSNLGPYTVYSSSTLDSAPVNPPQGETLACLSCHDGTVALNVIKSGTLPVTLTPVDILAGRDSDLTTDLTNDHPVSFTYDHLVDPGLRTIEQAKTSGIKFYGLSEDQLECGSCHNAHDPTHPPFLRIENVGSALCVSCHLK